MSYLSISVIGHCCQNSGGTTVYWILLFLPAVSCAIHLKLSGHSTNARFRLKIRNNDKKQIILHLLEFPGLAFVIKKQGIEYYYSFSFFLLLLQYCFVKNYVLTVISLLYVHCLHLTTRIFANALSSHNKA